MSMSDQRSGARSRLRSASESQRAGALPLERRFVAVLQAVFVLMLAGCLPWCPTPIPTPPEPQLEVVEEQQGWVQVSMTEIPSAGYKLHWGDVTGLYGTSEAVPPEQLLEHFYQAISDGTSGGQVPTQYEILLTDPEGQVVAREPVWVRLAACHVSLISLDERTVTVRCWGRFGVGYSISWGDRFADQFIVDDETATIILHHMYRGPGTYAIGMQEVIAPAQQFLTVTVE